MPALKKLLILIEWFAPGYKAGGPIQSCVNLCIALKYTYQIYVLTTDTDHGETRPYENVGADKWVTETSTGVMVYYAKKKALSITKVNKLINEINPDFIYLNLFFSRQFVLYPLWLKYNRTIKGQIVLCPRGTLYDSAISLKRYKKVPFLRLLKWMGIHKRIIFHATNDREEKAIARYFPAAKIVVADNLPSTSQTLFNTCLKSPGSLQCIFISRIVPIKNLLFLLQLMQEMHEQITLTIIGPIEQEDYWAACEKAISLSPKNIHVKFLGARQNKELSALIQQHHLFISPTTGESFGHAIFESFLAGRPVLISDQTPWQGLEESNAGWVLPLESPEKFVEVLSHVAACNQDQFDQYARGAWNYASNFINNRALTEQYNKLFY